MERKELEVMAPAGNFECLRAAIQGGADAVYFGVGHLNMRSHSANNFAQEDLPAVVRICHEAGVRAYLTLNIVIYDEEIGPMQAVLDDAARCGVDAVIASDLAVVQACRARGLEVHLSTQLNISNIEALRFYAQFAEVAVLARELKLEQVAAIHEAVLQEGICGPSGRPVRLEMFVHGALCMAISGKCYLSLHTYGTSANRGGCYQLCRRGYRVTEDLCTIEFLDKIAAAGVRVFKIEGRARNPEYVKRTTQCYRRAADAVADGTFTAELGAALKEELADVFNRGFWDGYYQGAPLGEWSTVYGSQARRHKEYCGKVTNWYSKLGVAEITVESATLHVGDEILFMGPTTGVVETRVEEIRLDLAPVPQAVRGDVCSVPVRFSGCAGGSGENGNAGGPGDGIVRRGDKVYLWVES